VVVDHLAAVQPSLSCLAHYFQSPRRAVSFPPVRQSSPSIKKGLAELATGGKNGLHAPMGRQFHHSSASSALGQASSCSCTGSAVSAASAGRIRR